MNKKGVFLLEENPFLNDEKEYVYKPYKKENLTENQKQKNLKGIKMVMENLKKIKPFFRYIK